MFQIFATMGVGKAVYFYKKTSWIPSKSKKTFQNWREQGFLKQIKSQMNQTVSSATDPLCSRMKKYMELLTKPEEAELILWKISFKHITLE